MPDLDMNVTISRDALGLADLDVNDHVNYKVGPQFFGGQVSWNRQKVGSIFVNGERTTQRSLQNVEEPASFEILAETDAGLQTNMATLKAALMQDDFVVTIEIGDATYAYACEAADVQTVWMGVRFMAKRGSMVFTIPRQPDPLVGAV